MPDYIKREIIRSEPMEYIEDVESVTVFPISGEIEVVTYKKFLDKDGNTIRTEAGETERFKEEIPGIIDRVRRAVIRRRG